MSLFKDIPRLDLKPNVARALSPTAWQDYFILLWWIFFFPQALRDQVATHTQDQAQRSRLLQMAATLFLVLLFLLESAILIAQILVAKVAWPVAWQGLLAGSVIGGLIVIAAFMYARSQEISAALRQLGQAMQQSLWRVVKPLLQRILRFALQRALGQLLGPRLQRLFQLIVGKPTHGEQADPAIAPRKFARGLVVGVAGGLTGALGGSLFLTPMLEGTFVDFTTAPLYTLLVGSSLGITLNLLIALSEQPHYRVHMLSRWRLLGAGLTLPVIGSIQSIANPDVLVDLSLDALSVAGTGALVFYLSAWLAAQRPLDWVVHRYLVELQLARNPSQITPPHVTLWPLRNLQSRLEGWLATDWEGGLKNAHQLWLYTCQYKPITAALHNVLAALPGDQQVEQVVRFVDHKAHLPWLMILYGKQRRSKTIADFQSTEQDQGTLQNASAKYKEASRREMRQRLVGKEMPLLLPLDFPAQAATAGYWYLTNRFVEESVIAFQTLPQSALNDEIQSLAQAFFLLLFKEKLLEHPRAGLPKPPKEMKRKATWDALDDFATVVRYGWLYKQCTEPSKQAMVKDLALQKLTMISQQAKIARPDRLAILAILKIWIEDFARWTAIQHKPANMKAVNPFICFEPLREQPPFGGRKEQLGQLKQAWMQGTRQPVLLHGHVQSGKTSLLQRARDTHKEYAVVIPIHLAVVRKSGNLTNRILWTIFQAIADDRGYRMISEKEFNTDPYAITERVIRHACSELNRTVVLAIDEFDWAYRARPAKTIIETMDLVPNLPATEKLLEFWWHLYRSIHNLTFVFIIESPPNDFPPSELRNHLWSLPITHLDAAAASKVLTKPCPEFSPLFTPCATDHIFGLTQGQPFLGQLIGHWVMQQFNQGLPKDPQPDPVFTDIDVEHALTQPLCWQAICHHYATLLRQLEAGHSGSEASLCAIAQNAQGLTAAELQTKLPSTVDIETVIQFLHDQEILAQKDGRWDIKAGLLRRYLHDSCQQTKQ